MRDTKLRNIVEKEKEGKKCCLLILHLINELSFFMQLIFYLHIIYMCDFLILFENFYKKIPSFHTMWFTPYIFPPTSCFCLTMHATCPWQHTRGGRAILQGGTSSGWAELVSAHIRWARAGQWWMGGNISRPNWVSWYYHVELFFSIKDKDDWSQVIPYRKNEELAMHIIPVGLLW